MCVCEVGRERMCVFVCVCVSFIHSLILGGRKRIRNPCLPNPVVFFSQEVQGGRLSSSSLDKYTCVALAGVVTEYLSFGQAEGGMGDILQLDGMFRALQVRARKGKREGEREGGREGWCWRGSLPPLLTLPPPS